MGKRLSWRERKAAKENLERVDRIEAHRRRARGRQPDETPRWRVANDRLGKAWGDE